MATLSKSEMFVPPPPNNIAQQFGLEENTTLDNPAKGFLAGIECEIESLISEQAFPYFTNTEDGSLRNNGREFISVPLGRADLISAFSNLHAKIQYIDKKQAFSPRTSTHVHINCRHLTNAQVKTVILLYALFEECFFAMVSPDRRNNIHCVPLTETYLPSNYKHELVWMFKKWHKYTALNILPLGKIGTIEFRHMQGTDDVVLMNEWLTTLENLWEMGKVVHITRENISDERTISIWYDQIFSHSERMVKLKPAVPNLIKNSIIDVKMSLTGN